MAQHYTKMNRYNNRVINGTKVDIMGNYHGGCKKSCCRNAWGSPTKSGITNNCKVK